LKPWEDVAHLKRAQTLKGLRRNKPKTRRNSFRVATNKNKNLTPQGFKANPGLKLANAFSVKTQTAFLLSSLLPRNAEKNILCATKTQRF
jgi:hypothetical protein